MRWIGWATGTLVFAATLLSGMPALTGAVFALGAAGVVAGTVARRQPASRRGAFTSSPEGTILQGIAMLLWGLALPSPDPRGPMAILALVLFLVGWALQLWSRFAVSPDR